MFCLTYCLFIVLFFPHFYLFVLTLICILWTINIINHELFYIRGLLISCLNKLSNIICLILLNYYYYVLFSNYSDLTVTVEWTGLTIILLMLHGDKLWASQKIRFLSIGAGQLSVNMQHLKLLMLFCAV